MSLSDFEIVNSEDFREGDILLGPEHKGGYTPFSNRWEIVSSPKIKALSVTVDLRHAINRNKVSGWSTSKGRKWAIQRRELQYDPMQQGDTDEDI